MSGTMVGLRHTIQSASDLQSVVRTMKTLAAASVGQYEQSVLALGDYYRTVELGLGACFRNLAQKAAGSDVLMEAMNPMESSVYGKGTDKGIGEGVNMGVNMEVKVGKASTIAIVFGSDQGLVGRFNDAIAEYAITQLSTLPERTKIWAVGERVHARLKDLGWNPDRLFALPNSVSSIASLVGKLQIEGEKEWGDGAQATLFVFRNSPQSKAAYSQVSQILLPLDSAWQEELAASPWPRPSVPQVMGEIQSTLRGFIGEFLFISLFRACAESLASENTSRLAAMERADKNINELLEELNSQYHRMRQSSIDEELFDVISGAESTSV